MYLEAELDDANMDECEHDFVDDTGLFEDEASDESVGSEVENWMRVRVRCMARVRGERHQKECQSANG